MTVLQVADLRFGYDAETLFENVTLTLALGDRVALVAPNGSGKTTLLRILAKEIEPDAGSAVVRRDATVGYYRQSHEIATQGDVLGAFLSGFGAVMKLRDELHRAQQDAASGTAMALEHLARVTDRYHLVGGDELEHRVAALASHLGFSNADLARSVASLSGGEQGRLRLGIVLAQQPDILLLDEPTNHLDLYTITWLEQWLAECRGAVLVVSHDRAFLDHTCNTTLELGRRGVRTYPARYSEYVELRKQDLARERALAERQSGMIAKTEDFIRKNIAGQKTKQAQSRRKMLDKLDRVARPEDTWETAERVAFRFAPAARTGDIVLDAQGVSAERGGRTLFSDFDILVRRGERIGIVGPNGAGKTTLLKVLAGRGAPDDEGDVKRGTNLQEGYFDQQLGDVDPELTAVDNVRRIRGDLTVEAARQYLARFRFWGDDPLRTVRGFSGGERARLALAKLLLEPKNLLFLDEPTNHLDIPAAEILEEALMGFEGTMLVVSHDRRFLENVTTRIVSVRSGRAEVYPGAFRDYEQSLLNRRVEGDGAAGRSGVDRKPRALVRDAPSTQTTQTKGGGAAIAAPRPPPPGESEVAKQKFEAQRQAARAIEKNKRRIRELETAIAAGERDLDGLRGKLKEAPADGWEKLTKMAQEERALTRRVDAMLLEWAKLSEGAP
jgi:ATP-binding cassette subfamily F protein 3